MLSHPVFKDISIYTYSRKIANIYIIILLKNTQFRTLPLDIKPLGTMTSIKFSQVYVDLCDEMASSDLHSSWEYFKRYEHMLICLYVFISGPMAGLFWPNIRPFILLKNFKHQMTGPLVFLRLM